MSEFGNTLFSRSPLIRWTLVPVLVISAVLFGGVFIGAALERDLVPALVALVLTVGCLAMTVALIFPRCGWAFRVVTGLVFVVCLAYLVHMWGFKLDEGIGWQSDRSEANPRNALLCFIIVGLPCLWYTVLGRFTRQPSGEVSIENSDASGDDSKQAGAARRRPPDPRH